MKAQMVDYMGRLAENKKEKRSFEAEIGKLRKEAPKETECWAVPGGDSPVLPL